MSVQAATNGEWRYVYRCANPSCGEWIDAGHVPPERVGQYMVSGQARVSPHPKALELRCRACKWPTITPSDKLQIMQG